MAEAPTAHPVHRCLPTVDSIQVEALDEVQAVLDRFKEARRG